MKKLVLSILMVLLMVGYSYAQTMVRGYFRKDGTYVQPYYRTSPNYTVRDNYSYKGNVNPFTGKKGSSYYRDDLTSGYYGTSSWGSNSYDRSYYMW